jgi:hypothetical protein
MESKTCATCKYYLGGGCCNMNLEEECGEGMFEMWTPTDKKTTNI